MYNKITRIVICSPEVMYAGTLVRDGGFVDIEITRGISRYRRVSTRNYKSVNNLIARLEQLGLVSKVFVGLISGALYAEYKAKPQTKGEKVTTIDVELLAQTDPYYGKRSNLVCRVKAARALMGLSLKEALKWVNDNYQ